MKMHYVVSSLFSNQKMSGILSLNVIVEHERGNGEEDVKIQLKWGLS